MKKVAWLIVVISLSLGFANSTLASTWMGDPINTGWNIPAPTSKTTAMANNDLFYDHWNWTKWLPMDYDPTYLLLTTQIQFPHLEWNRPLKSIVMDVNGDWLPDLLIGANSMYTYYNETYDRNMNTYATTYALLINKWNMDYDIAYRCVRINASAFALRFYWDCAKPSIWTWWPSI